MGVLIPDRSHSHRCKMQLEALAKCSGKGQSLTHLLSPQPLLPYGALLGTVSEACTIHSTGLFRAFRALGLRASLGHKAFLSLSVSFSA